MIDTIALTLIVLAAGFLQGLTGFGFVLIALPLLGLFLPLKTIIPLLIMLALCISFYLSIQLRRSIRFRNIVTLFIATLPGIPLGVYTLQRVSPQTLSLGLGLLMISFTSYQLLATPKPRPLGTWSSLLAGVLSGILAGSIGAGGPPVIIYSALQPWSKDESKATLAFYFAVTGLIVSINHAITGLITEEVLHYFLISLPALLVGIILGVFGYKHISDHGYRKLAFILVFLLGCMIIYRNI